MLSRRRRCRRCSAARVRAVRGSVGRAPAMMVPTTVFMTSRRGGGRRGRASRCRGLRRCRSGRGAARVGLAECNRTRKKHGENRRR
jgi:hypothetical protein